MNSDNKNSQRIAKNTVVLFGRMIVLLLVGLYTSRVLLEALGFEDYGIYCAIGGFVTLFTLISGQLSAAIGRFLTYYLGKGDEEKLIKVFSTSVNVQIIFSAIAIVLAESVGIWFFHNKLDIPESRIYAAMWVYQLSVFSFCVNLISVPYNAAIVAHEKMSAFAYISILEVLLKLCIVFVVLKSSNDALITYAVLMLIVAIGIRFVYGIYCKKKFKECSYHFIFDKKLFSEMVRFSGWNFFGSATSVFMSQGINVLMNVFFGVVVNAASGIATQLNGVLENFVNNFTTAVNPQITKSYAKNDFDYMHKLVIKGALFSFYLFFFISLPLFIEAKQVLDLWLKNVPPFAVLFLRLTIINNIIRVFGRTMITAILATGNIKKYQLSIGSIGFVALPVVYILYKMGLPVYWGYIVDIIVYSLFLLVRLRLCGSLIGLSGILFFKEVLVKAALVALVCTPLPCYLFYTMEESLGRLCIVSVASVIVCCLFIYLIGISKDDRLTVQNKMRNFFGRLKK